MGTIVDKTNNEVKEDKGKVGIVKGWLRWLVPVKRTGWRQVGQSFGVPQTMGWWIEKGRGKEWGGWVFLRLGRA